MKRIAVTGGNGYVGRELVRELMPDNEVCVIDNLASGPKRFSQRELHGLRFAQADITDGRQISALFEEFRPEVVIHLAAVHYIPQCERDPVGAVTTNVVGTMTVLRHMPAGSRIVFASSGAVYKPDTAPHTESSLQQPSDIYGLTKQHCEHYVANVASARDLEAVVIRLFNVVGPGETNPHLLPEIVAQLKAGRRVVKLGNLWPRRDYIHVKDAASGFAAAALADHLASGEALTLNLGTSRSSSVSDVIEMLRDASEIHFDVEEDEHRTRKVDRPFLTADTTRIRERLAWQPRYTVVDAVRDLWAEPELTHALQARYL